MIYSDRLPLRDEPLVYACVTPPAGDVVELGKVLRHLRLDEDDTDEVETDVITGAIAAAVGHVDGRAGVLNRALLTQTWQVTASRPSRAFCDTLGFVLDLAPIQAVTKVEALQGGTYTVLAADAWRITRLTGDRLAVLPGRGLSWPVVDVDPEAWRITFRSGYGDAGTAVPAPIRSAILLMVSDLYDNRDGKVQANMVENPTVDRLLDPFRRIQV